MDVLLIRHATAVPAVGRLGDHDRHLTIEGRRSALSVGQKLNELGFAPRVVYTSPLVRAVQTAELVSVGLAPERVETLVPLSTEIGTVAEVLSVLSRHGDAETIVLVTHEPKVRSIAAALAGAQSFPHFDTAGVACFHGPAGSTRLKFRLDPSDLRVIPASSPPR